MESRFSRNAQRILDALHEGPLTVTRISKEIFNRNLTSGQIEEALREIEPHITCRKQQTAGRDATVIELREP